MYYPCTFIKISHEPLIFPSLFVLFVVFSFYKIVFLSRNFEVILISGVAQGEGGNAETK